MFNRKLKARIAGLEYQVRTLRDDLLYEGDERRRNINMVSELLGELGGRLRLLADAGGYVYFDPTQESGKYVSTQRTP